MPHMPAPLTETITLERTGNAPLRFTGHLLTTACGQFVEPPMDRPNMDFYTISIYAVSDRPDWYVVAIKYTKAFRETIAARAEERGLTAYAVAELCRAAGHQIDHGSVKRYFASRRCVASRFREKCSTWTTASFPRF